MGGIGGMLGTAGGAAGTGFSGPQSADLIVPTDVNQLKTAYTGTQDAMTQQQNLLAALQAQNGLQNQSNVYNQLQGIVNGTGPNPAKAQLAQATGANTANQAALMAGQRGASQNAGLIARQAAMQGGANQQQAAGQAATMQAQQSLNALSAAGQIAGTQASNQIGQVNANTQAQQAEQQNLLNAAGNYNSASVGMQSNINNINGQLANTQLQGQQAMVGGLMNSMGGASGMLGGVTSMFAKGGKIGYDDGGQIDSMPQEQPASADESSPSADFGNFQGSNAAVAAPNTSTPSFGSDAGASALGQGASSMGGGKSSGGGGGGMGSMLGLLALMADGGVVQSQSSSPTQSDTGYQGKSKFGAFVKDQQKAAATPMTSPSFGGNAGAKAIYEGLSAKPQAQPATITPSNKDASNIDEVQSTSGKNIVPTIQAAEGGKVPAMVSPGEQYLTPSEVHKALRDGQPLKHGERIPGKPKVGGAKNSYKNDTVPKDLEEGGIVIPRSITQGKNPHWEAMRFVHKTLKKGKKP
jgi:hypothetical protein